MADIEKAPLLAPHDHVATQGSPSEDEVEFLRQNVSEAREAYLDANKQYIAAWRQTRPGRIVSRINTCVLCTASAMAITMVGLMLFLTAYAMIYDDDVPLYKPPVKLEAHIMSKCPDALDCLNDLILPTMMEVSRDVDFTLSYIGSPNAQGDGVVCKHGPEECLGNMIELCAAQLYPDPKISLGFTMCMTRQYHDIPQVALVKDCALEHGISFEKLNDCASDERRGLDLLKTSVDRSQKLNVSTSCTVRLDDKVWCVRDDGEWKDCPGGSGVRDLVSEIRKLRHPEA